MNILSNLSNSTYDYKALCIMMITLVILQTMVHHYPDLQKYNSDTRFNYYRSLMCLSFTGIALNIGVNHFQNGFSHPFSFQHNDFKDVQNIFMAYLIVDLLKLIADKNKRIDLYLHHILCMVTIIIANNIGKFGYLHCIILACEAISIVTGVDSMALEDNDDYLSYQCKRFRKGVINYIRLPMWITVIIFTLKYTNRAPSILWYNCLISSIIMICLDRYWLGKCEKVIKKYEK
jgi:hypothetical protein